MRLRTAGLNRTRALSCVCAILKNVIGSALSLVCLSSQAQVAQGSTDNHGHAGYVTSVAFSDDSAYLATTGWDRTVKIWNPATGKLLKTIALSTRIRIKELCFRPGTDQLAYQDGAVLRLLDIASGQEVAALGWDRDKR